MLSSAFDLTTALRKQQPETSFFVLYDSLKQSCCSDVLGAQHVNYDCLVHFGKACFSEPNQPHHFYIFQECEEEKMQKVVEVLRRQETIDFLLKKQIEVVMADQKYYQVLKESVFKSKDYPLDCLRLSFDKHKDDEYIAFGYYGSSKNFQKNILLISDDNSD